MRRPEDPNQVALAESLAEYLNSDFGSDLTPTDVLVGLSATGLSLAPSDDARVAMALIGSETRP